MTLRYGLQTSRDLFEKLKRDSAFALGEGMSREPRQHLENRLNWSIVVATIGSKIVTHRDHAIVRFMRAKIV
jgi:hypothetical protein